jgi:LPS-assembly protein
MSWFYPSTPRTRLAWLFAALVTAAYAPAPAHAAAKAKPKRVGAADKDAPVTILADQADGRADREVKLNGNVEINRADTTLQSERARYDVVEDTVEAYGKVRIDRAGDHYTGTELQLNLESGKGRVLQPTYSSSSITRAAAPAGSNSRTRSRPPSTTAPTAPARRPNPTGTCAPTR